MAFSLYRCNECSIRTISDLKENFDRDSVYGAFVNGRLTDWLRQLKENKKAKSVLAISKEEDRDVVLKNLYEILTTEQESALEEDNEFDDIDSFVQDSQEDIYQEVERVVYNTASEFEEDSDCLDAEEDVMPIIIKYDQKSVKRHDERFKVKYLEHIKQYEGVKNCIFIKDADYNTKSGKTKEQVKILINGTNLSIRVEIDGKCRSFFGPTFFDESFVVPKQAEEYKVLRGRIVFVDIEKIEDELDILEKYNWDSRDQREDLKSFVTGVKSLRRPLREINKQEDQDIWRCYSDGLEALTKAKQELQKIVSIGKPLKEKNFQTIELNIEALNYQDTLKENLLDALEDTYAEMPVFTSNKNTCELTFNSYREIPQDDMQMLSSTAIQCCYRMKNEDFIPDYVMEGQITLDTTEEDKIEQIQSFDEMLSDYDDNYPKKNGMSYMFINDEDATYAIDELNKRFGEILYAEKETELECHLTVEAKHDDIRDFEKLLGNKTTVKQDGIYTIIDSKSFLQLDNAIFDNMDFDQCMVKLTVQEFDEDVIVPAALSVEDGYYVGVIVSSQKEELNKRVNGWSYAIANKYLKKGIKNNHPRLSFEYKFRNDANSRRQLKELARNISDDSIRLIVSRNVALLKPYNEEDYYRLQKLIVDNLPEGVRASFDSYAPRVKVGFCSENPEYINDCFLRITNQVASMNISQKRDNDTLRFSFKFKNENERDENVKSLKTALDPFARIASIQFKHQTGKTIIKFDLDNKLKTEYLNKLGHDYRNQDVRILSSEYDELLSKLEKAEIGDDSDKIRSLQKEKRDMLYKSKKMGVCYKRTKDTLVVKLDKEFIEKYENKDVKIGKGDYVHFPLIGEMENIRRQKNALDKILRPGQTYGGRRIGYAVNQNLSNFLFDPRYAGDIDGDLDEYIKNIKESSLDSKSELNKKQLEAVAKAVAAKDIAFIQGPPGTGKTTVIAEIIWQEILRNKNCKILLTSQTNLAVDNALERLQGKRGIRPVRIVNQYGEEKLEREGRRYLLAQMDEWVAKTTEENEDNAVNSWIETISNSVQSEGKYAQVVSSWKKDLMNKDNYVRKSFGEAYKRNVNLIAATCSICGSNILLGKGGIYEQLYGSNKNIEFDVVIMDEASKATPLEMAVPMVLAKKIIVIGDHKQLPPMIDDEEVKASLVKINRAELIEKINNIKESQFKRLFEHAQQYRKNLVAPLDTQYRMHEQIMKCINQFYMDDIEGGLRCGILDNMNDSNFNNKASRYHGLTNEPLLRPDVHAIWVDVDGKESQEGTSWKNEAELDAIKKVIQKIETASGFCEYMKNMTRPEDREIGIITFYGAQARSLKVKRQNGSFGDKLDFRIDVVDRFQGMERNIVIVSTVRTDKIGFAKEIERINVAFSRAKRLLIVVGDRDFFFQNSENYRNSINSMETISVNQLD